MSDQFVAEIRIFAGNFAPRGWASCDGQLMAISQNTALFSLLGTYYGGDGKSTFGLPNLAGMVPIAQGQGQGLTERFLGETSGSPSVTLLISEIPVHTHNLQAYNGDPSDSRIPNPNEVLGTPSPGSLYGPATPQSDLALMAPQALSVIGGSLPHNNMQPYLALYYIIALQGIFPARG